jgi:hypothetical protein
MKGWAMLVRRYLARILSITLIASACSPPSGTAAELPGKVDFNSEIRPILSDRCYKCHGPDNNTRKAKLRLDHEESAKATSNGGLPVVQPGNTGRSELYLRITATDPDEKMPPPDSNVSLDPEEIGLIKRWIDQGATWGKHWSFESLQDVPVPGVKQDSWPRNPIDHFILNRLERENLKPSPSADKEALIRRVAFDLTGLPPTLEEIDTFVEDTESGAYERMIEAFLSKPAYGEEMTVEWLDLARYSDTFGYQVDRDRFVWPWRDWVIRAFNRNMPYDQFVTWQLAGDLLPNPTDEQILATTFNRLHPQKVEGGSTPEEFRVEYVADRTHTFGTAFLGLTLQCSRCHDHKYDPLTQKEYYQLFAFFNNIDEAGLYSYFTPAVPTPTPLMADDATKTKLAGIESRIQEAARAITKTDAQRNDAFEKWLANSPADPLIPGLVADFSFDELKDGKFPNRADPDSPATTSDQNVLEPGHHGNALRLTGDDAVQMQFGNFRRFDPFTVALWMKTPDVKDRAVVYHRSQAWTDAGSRGYELLIEDGRLSAALIHFWPGNALRLRTVEPIPTNTWTHVTVTYDGSSQAGGLAIHVNGQPASVEVVRDHLSKNITGGGGDFISIGERMRDRGFKDGLVDDFQVFSRALSPIEVAHLHDGHALRDLLARPTGDLNPGERRSLFDYYLSAVDPVHAAALRTLRDLRIERSRAIDGIEEIMVMRDLPVEQARPSFVLVRGAYDTHGEPVTANTQAALSPFPENAPQNRLGLAQWLTDPRHPLFARVTANRIWQRFFGDGLVRTPEDFGSQGEPPTHPELLDWLANRLISSGWDLKDLMRTIVQSAAYQQSSEHRPELTERDPKNRLLARVRRNRLSSEMIRDNALAVSDLLARNMGGPPAKPYEVGVSFKPVTPDTGIGLYRRSLYTYWKRTAPAPVMMALDASKRDVCVIRREQTSTPLQALVLLNDPQTVEAACLLAQKLILRHGTDSEAAIQEMFRLLTSRKPSHAEMEVLERLHREQSAYFENNAESASRFLGNANARIEPGLEPNRLAALGTVGLALMNFDDCLRKR